MPNQWYVTLFEGRNPVLAEIAEISGDLFFMCAMNHQLTLPGLTVALADKSRRGVGTTGELIVAHWLEKSGWLVSFTAKSSRCGDLRVVSPETGQVYYVEVKTARQGRDGRWKFTLWKKGCTDHHNADFVVLLPILRSGRAVPFVVPVTVLAAQKQAVIGKHPERYEGKLAAYRQVGGIRL